MTSTANPFSRPRGGRRPMLEGIELRYQERLIRMASTDRLQARAVMGQAHRSVPLTERHDTFHCLACGKRGDLPTMIRHAVLRQADLR